MKNLFILLSCVLITTTVISQSAEEAENWLYSIEKEFPEIDRSSSTSTLRSGAPKFNQIRFNLLSDSYFVPVFGKPFDELSSLKRNLIAKKIGKLKRQKKFGSHEIKYPWAKRLDWYLWGAFIQANPYEMAAKEVLSLRKIRQQYKAAVQSIKGGEINFDYLASEKIKLASDYSKLLPSEIEDLKNLIETKNQVVANKQLLDSADKLKSLENSFASLMKLKAFKNENKEIYQSANQETRDRAESQNEIKTNQILDYLVTTETANLNTKSISELNDFHSSFYNKYSDFNGAQYKQVTAVDAQIKNLKTIKVVAQLQDIETKIRLTDNDNELYKLEDLYLLHIDQSKDPKIVGLTKTFDAKKEALINAKNQVWQEDEEQRLLSDEIITEGLYYAEFYDYIYRGHFENLEITPDDLEFLMIFGKYLNAYGTHCDQYLPADKVEIQELVCKTERVTKNAFGAELYTTCIEYVWRGTGIFAKRDLYKAKIMVSNKHNKSAAEVIVETVTDANSVGNSVDMAHKGAGLDSDLNQLFKLNSGDGDAIKRFEENLKRFARYEPSIRIAKESKYVTMKKMGGPTAPQNHDQFLDDLIVDQSKTWSYNRYKKGSVYNLAPRVGKNGTIYQYYANYLYMSFGAEKIGVVTVKFENGLPECIYFSDFPENCKTPKPSIVTAFTKGDYTAK